MPKNNIKSLGFGSDTMFVYDKCAIDSIKNGDDFYQAQLVGVENLNEATLETPAYVIRFNSIPSNVWIGEYSGRKAFINNGDTTSLTGTDSGMTVSYKNVSSVDVTFLIGTVEQTGAVAPCSSNTTKNSIVIEDSTKDTYYAVFDGRTGQTKIAGWTLGLGNTPDDHKNLILTGMEDDTDYIIKAVLASDYHDGDPDPSKVEQSRTKTKLDLEKTFTKSSKDYTPKFSTTSDSVVLENANPKYSYILVDEEGNTIDTETDEEDLDEGDALLTVETDPETGLKKYTWSKLKPGKYFVIGSGSGNTGEVELTVSSGSKKYKAKDVLDTGDKISGTGKKGSTRTITTDTSKELVSIIVKDKDGNKIDLTDNGDGTYSFKQPASDVTVEIKYEEPSQEEKLIDELMKDDVKRADSNEGQVIDPNAKFINGYEDGTFLPNKTVSNIELMSMVTELYTDAVKGNGNELDLNQGDNAWATEIIKAANKLGLVPGDKNDPSYDLADEVTRADLAVVIYNLIKDYTASPALTDNCTDAKGKSYEKAVAKLVELGVLKGYDDGLFHGENTLTRAEAVVVINRALRSLGFEINTPSITKSFPDLTPSHWAYYEIMFAANK